MTPLGVYVDQKSLAFSGLRVFVSTENIEGREEERGGE